MDEHLIFFDGECPFCHRSVRHIIENDPQRHFLFAPLAGTTAKDVLSGPQKHLQHANSLVLVEHFRSTHREFWIRSKAIFRIYWLLGKRIRGSLCFFPGWLGDLVYRWVAEHRHQFKIKMPREPGPRDRFLP